MVVRTISVLEAGARFGELAGSVHDTKEPIIVEQNGKPYAVLISPEQYEHLRLAKAWQAIERIRERNADKTEEDVLADVTAEVEAVRQATYERQHRAS